MLREFKEFVLKGNLLEIAVAFVLALAFAQVVSAFIQGIILPLIAAIVGQPDFNDLAFRVGDAEIMYGIFLTQVVNFLLIALVLFLIIRAYNRLRPPAAATMKPCPFCFTDVPLAATRCPACTSQLESTTA